MFTFRITDKTYCGISVQRRPNRLFIMLRSTSNNTIRNSISLNGTEVAMCAAKPEWKITHERNDGTTKILTSDGEVVKLGKTKICSLPTFQMLCRIAIGEFMRPSWRRSRPASTPEPVEEEDNEEAPF